MKLSTGSTDLNNFLKGYEIKHFNLIYGEPATGKTTLALLATIAQIKHNKKVIYIDTENGFSLERLQQLEPNIKQHLKNLIILKPNSFQEQHNLILNLPKMNIKLITIDTIGNYYRNKIKENHQKANKAIDNQLKHLRKLKIPTLILNQVYSTMDNNINCVGGKLIKNWCKNQIQLKKDPRQIIHKNKTLNFTIKQQGIFKTYNSSYPTNDDKPK